MSAETMRPGPRPAVPPVKAGPLPPARGPERAIGETLVRPAVAALLFACFVAIIGGVPAAELLGGEAGGREAWRSFLGGLAPRVVTELRGEGLFAANRLLLAEMSRLEDRLEEESVLVATVVPHTRALMLAHLGVAGPEVYPGRDGWLFYRADVEHITGPGFLEPAVLTARARGGDAWVAAPAPDPRPALERLRDELAARGIALVVMPTPVKPAIHPERLSRRGEKGAAPVANPSTPALLAQLEAAGIAVFDPSRVLVMESGERPSYLEGDTHWTPEAMDRVAAALAARLAQVVRRDGDDRVVWWRRPVSVEGSGDTARMLELPAWGQRLLPRQTIEIQQVTAPDGTLWRPARGAPVLVLGDSFTNVFSQPDLGWGAGAGLAEQLAYHLEAPVDRIAINAGGAHASREELARSLARGEGRLASTRVVVLQLAVRELSFGDWRVIPLGE